MANIFKPATAIVNEVLLEELTDEPCPSLPKPINLVKAANHLRQRHRPSDPVDLEFELQTEHIPDDFLRRDVKVSKNDCLLRKYNLRPNMEKIIKNDCLLRKYDLRQNMKKYVRMPVC